MQSKINYYNFGIKAISKLLNIQFCFGFEIARPLILYYGYHKKSKFEGKVIF